jgi:hypothetical protein
MFVGRLYDVQQMCRYECQLCVHTYMRACGHACVVWCVCVCGCGCGCVCSSNIYIHTH